MFQDILISLRSDFRSKRSEFKDTLKELQYDILRELKGVDQFTIDKDYHEKKCKIKGDEFIRILTESRKTLDKMVADVDDLNVDISSQTKNLKIEKENSLPSDEESLAKSTNKFPEFILHSRQTEEPFKLMTMKTGFRYKCSGCNQNIPIQSKYLSHIEEYPAGSKTFIPHSYHITANCLFQRGFEANYLENISVRSDKSINNDIINVLTKIGFKMKNIQLEISKITDCHIKEANDSDEFPDNVSEASDISSNPSVASSNTATSTFIYRRKHPNQKKNIPCHGCKLNIDTETYITYQNDNQSVLPFHIKKACLREGAFLSDDFSLAKCKVFQLLKTHSQLQELMDCGFLYNKILGYRPSNYNIKKSSISSSKESVSKPTNKVPELILRSRQTEEPFKLMTMKAGFRHKCYGCNQNIPAESLYLCHIEEYPAGSKRYIPNSYHITANCIFQRGFEVNYLKNISVSSDEPINIDIVNVLKEIGFKKKNIQMEISKFNNRQIKKADDSDDFSDNCSEISDVSSNPSVASSNNVTSTFIYRRKHPNQKKPIQCHGCKLNIDSESYIAIENENKFLPFHIKKACLKEGEVLPDDFSRANCKVYQLLKTHHQLKELIACGFYYNKILGYRPVNPNVKRSDRPKLKGNNEDNPDCTYIFNEEPFILERLPHGEKCKGCQNQVKRDEMSLRHKERVPRDKLEYSPLISQYYHANKQCLLNRGFTIKYLSFIKCNAILAGDDNLSRVTDVLIKCGFYNENIVYNPKSTAEPRGFEVASQPIRSAKEYKLFIDNCMNSSSHCEGCGFILIPNQSCFNYALQSVQDSNSKMFHIRNSCLKAHFTKEQLIALTCVTNNAVDVSPNEIINCGIVKIVTDDPIKAPVKTKIGKDFKAKFKKLSFDLDIVVDNRLICCSCKQNLMLDKYFIKFKGKPSGINQVHLDSNCVRKLGFSAAELAHSRLIYNVSVSSDGLSKLRNCGFRNLPRN